MNYSDSTKTSDLMCTNAPVAESSGETHESLEPSTILSQAASSPLTCTSSPLTPAPLAPSTPPQQTCSQKRAATAPAADNP